MGQPLILGRVSGIPRRFCRGDDIITNLAKEREPGIEIIERTPLSLIITRTVCREVIPIFCYVRNTENGCD